MEKEQKLNNSTETATCHKHHKILNTNKYYKHADSDKYKSNLAICYIYC